ncbi:IS1182 family transposase [Salinibacter ruber]|uniref:IS1182 family transposase n=1 Tax=Salinibacter ruber TaxID=146919 RepID=UPI002073A597|nr:IS1182 family transposase [Salinibacter ruber]
MSDRFRSVDRQMPYLMPPSLEEWLPEDHLARFVVETVETLDTTVLEKAYDRRGSDAYHPKMLLALLFYGYATGTYSSRKIEEATYDSVAFRYVADNQHPDHDTICTFRRRFLEELEGLFVQILEVAVEMGLLEVGDVALDGTKVKANASKHKALSYERACELEEQLTEEVEELMEKAEEADDEDLPDETSVPEEIARREKRLEKIREAKQTIEERARERHEAEKAAYEDKMEKRREEEKRAGRKKPGPKPEPPEDTGPEPDDQVNLTDEESRIMHTSENGFQQAYNAQATVCMNSHLILEGHLSQRANDKQELEPALQKLDQLPEKVGSPDRLAADSGYYSSGNARACEDHRITPYISTGREEHNQRWKKRFSAPEDPPEEESGLEAMAYRLETREGKDFYGRRKGTAEPVFGIVKEVMGIRQFLLRGLQKVKGEWALIRCAFNLKRMHRLLGQAA